MVGVPSPMHTLLNMETVAQTLSSNTGLNSQSSYTVGLDWLDITFRGVGSGDELQELLGDVGMLTNSPIDFCPNRPAFNGKHWSGSGRSTSGVMLWYNPPRDSTTLLDIAPDGNLLTHPGLLPPPYVEVHASEAKRIRKKLPSYVDLVYRSDREPYVCPVTGLAYPHHGYSIEGNGTPCEPMVGELKVAMPGAAMALVDVCSLSSYLKVYSSVYVVDCSRVDIALDDNHKAVSMEEIAKASEDGNYFGVQYTKRIESGQRGKQVGKTVYFGSSASDSKLRCYDKTVESNGATDCNRWEGEFHRKKAQVVFYRWLGWMSESLEVAVNGMKDIVLSMIDFRDRRSGDPNRHRCPQLDWYADMCERLMHCTVLIRVPLQQPDMQKSIDWVRSSVSQTLASIRLVLKDDFFPYLMSLLELGTANMSNIRRKIVDLTDVGKLCYDVPGLSHWQ